MANELDKMMQQYGLGSASGTTSYDENVIQPYLAQAVTPMFASASPMLASPMVFNATSNAGGSELDKLLTHYGLNAANQTEYLGSAGNQADQDVYNRYINEYQNRLKNTPMYGQSPWSDRLGYLQSPSRVFDFGLHPVTPPVDTVTTTDTVNTGGTSSTGAGGYSGGLNGGIDLSGISSNTNQPADTLVSYPDPTTPFVPSNPQTLVNGQYVNAPTDILGGVQTSNLNNAVSDAFANQLAGSISSLKNSGYNDPTGLSTAFSKYLDPNYQPVSTQDSDLVNNLRTVANGISMFAPNVEAGINSLFNDKSYDQNLASIKNELNNFQIENPNWQPALSAASSLGSYLVGGNPYDLYTAGKTAYNWATGNVPSAWDRPISNAVADAANSSDVLTPYFPSVNPPPPQVDVSQPSTTEPVTPFVDTAVTGSAPNSFVDTVVNSWNNPTYDASGPTTTPIDNTPFVPQNAQDFTNGFYSDWGLDNSDWNWGGLWDLANDYFNHTYGMGWFWGEDWNKGGSVHKYAEGGEVENQDLNALAQKYSAPDMQHYIAQLAQARQTAHAEQQAFNDLIQKHVQSGEAPESKAEMYFRLAAALAAPTHTGGLGETMSNAAQALGEYKSSARKEAANKLELALQAQKLKTESAREDVKSLSDMYKYYMEVGKPQSSAGKQAMDEGLTPGTPEYTKRVSQIGDLMNEAKQAQITASLGNLATGQAQLQNALTTQQLNQQKFEEAKKQSAKLTAPEIKLKEETENLLSNADQALLDLSKAYKLNPNTFDTSAPDIAQRKALELVGSKDEKLLNTRLQENLLGEQALEKLKTTFGGSPTEGERGILLSLQGIGSKSKEEREAIIKHAYQALKNKREVHNKRLNEINQGLYRSTTPETPDLGE